jgi:hypothetical protein
MTMVTRRRLSQRAQRYTTPRATSVDKHHLYAPAPGLGLILASQGVSIERLSEMTGYPTAYLQKLVDEDLVAPRIVTSRISAVLGVTHDEVREY